MGGYVFPPRQGFPPWDHRDDFNVQVDVAAAETVLARSTPTLVPLSLTVETALRRAHLPALRRAGRLGALIARQAEAQARHERTEERWGRPYPGLPDDTLAFLHDPLAAAVALGWRDRVRLETLTLVWERRDGMLRMTVDERGRRMPVAVEVDGLAFAGEWLRQVSGLAKGQRA